MQNNSSSTATASPKLSVFARAKLRVFGIRSENLPSGGSLPPHIITNPAAAITGAIAKEKAADLRTGQQRPQIAAANSSRDSGGSPGKHALENTAALIGFVTGKIPSDPAKLASYRSELEQRGMVVEQVQMPGSLQKLQTRVTMDRAAFSALPSAQQGEVMRSGVTLRERKAFPTPSEEAQSMELTFPHQPKSQRTAQQLMNLSASEVKKVTEETADEKNGRERRQEIFDAFDSYAGGHWGNTSGVNDDGGRMAFYKKFADVIRYCNLYGPRESTPNDPAPPVDPKAMTAGQWLMLAASVSDSLRAKMQGQSSGRLIRAELKRAYENASATERAALLGEFGAGLRAFPKEFI